MYDDVYNLSIPDNKSSYFLYSEASPGGQVMLCPDQDSIGRNPTLPFSENILSAPSRSWQPAPHRVLNSADVSTLPPPFYNHCLYKTIAARSFADNAPSASYLSFSPLVQCFGPYSKKPNHFPVIPWQYPKNSTSLHLHEWQSL